MLLSTVCVCVCLFLFCWRGEKNSNVQCPFEEQTSHLMVMLVGFATSIWREGCGAVPVLGDWLGGSLAKVIGPFDNFSLLSLIYTCILLVVLSFSLTSCERSKMREGNIANDRKVRGGWARTTKRVKMLLAPCFLFNWLMQNPGYGEGKVEVFTTWHETSQYVI